MRISGKMFAVPVAAATLLVSAGGASAAPPEVQIIVEKDLSGFIINDCNGEVVTFTQGTFRTVILTYADGSTKERLTTQLKGTGTSGARYVINETLQDNFDGTAYSGSLVSVLVSRGPQPNQIATFHWDGDDFTGGLVCHG